MRIHRDRRPLGRRPAPPALGPAISRPRLSVCLIAHDEAKDLERCLKSVRGWANEIVVVDCDSQDDTAKVARRFGARVFKRPNHTNIHLNTSFAIERGKGPWLLNLDPDEIVSPALKRTIDRAISDPDAAAAFDMPRKNYYFGQWLRWGGKYPDSVRRLYRKGKAYFPNKHVHEKVRVDGEIGKLTEPVDHHPYPDLEMFFKKLIFYAKFQAEFLRKSGRQPTIFLGFTYLFWRPVRRFLSRYVMKLGFLDGLPGFLACLHDGLFHWLTWYYLSKRN